MENKYLWSGWPSYASLFSTFPELRQTLLPRVGILNWMRLVTSPEMLLVLGGLTLPHAAAAILAFNNSFEIFFNDHSPGLSSTLVCAGLCEPPVQWSISELRPSSGALSSRLRNKLQSKYPEILKVIASPRHQCCQGYRWSHREYLLNPLKFNGEHKSGMRGIWNTILFLWRRAHSSDRKLSLPPIIKSSGLRATVMLEAMGLGEISGWV